ncbi:MAG TPA: hypothetical protein VIJ26_15720 [Thermoanaerobaculia bacterium]
MAHSLSKLKEWGEDVSKRGDCYVIPEQEQASQLAILDSFKDLRAGWDSYSAEPPSIEAIENARRILRVLWEGEVGAAIRLSPSVEGGVSIIFRSMDKRYADIECFNDGEALAITSDPRSEPVVWSINLAPDELRNALGRITTFLNG